MHQLKLLGGAVVLHDDGAVHELSSRRHPVALLALLATAPALTLSRARLIGLLWPDVSESTARNRLTSCAYDVRAALGADVLVTVGADLRLDPDRIDCDVVRFLHAVHDADHEAAASLYGGPFLDGFYLAGSVDFEQRVDRERDRLRWSYHQSLEHLAGAARQRGDTGGAGRWWRLRAADDPYDSRVASELVATLAADGNRAEALRIAQTHVDLLEHELGAPPDSAFQRLVERLRTPARSRPAGPAAPTSVAVLPFEAVGSGAEAEAFAAGLHQDLLTELARSPGLTVISRGSVLHYRGARQPLADIARELGVGTVVEGSVQVAGGRIRLNVQLVDAERGVPRWVERFDRDLSGGDVLHVQGELAARIARTLHAELDTVPRRQGTGDANRDLEAFRLCAQGRAFIDQRTSHALTLAIPYFQRAIARDPSYALAWAGLADALSVLEFYDYPVPDDVPDALVVARRAVELDPELGPAHASLGIIQSIRQRGPAAMQQLEHAIRLAPGYAEAHVWLAWVRLVCGDAAGALAPARRAAELDPLAPAIHAYLAITWLAHAELDRALDEAMRAREIQPGYGLAHYTEGLVLYHLDRFEPACAAFDAARALVPPDGTPSHVEIDAALALTRAAAGRHDDARDLLARITRARHPFSAALVYAALGDQDAALAALDQVRDWRSFATELVRYCFPRVLDPVRSDERFRAVLHQVNRAWGID